MKMKLQFLSLGILLSFHACADGYLTTSTPQDQAWSVSASVGNGRYQYFKGSKAPLARLTLNNELVLTGDIALGLELGVQNGHKMRLRIPKETIAVLQWLPVRTNLGPMFDLLVTAKSDPLCGSAFFAQLKGGVAYRSWDFKQLPIRDISQLAGEIQAGFGYPITALANLSLLYQGVYSNEPQLALNLNSKTGHVDNIPSLHAVLLGFSVNL